jgi:hypothetical protein
MTNDLTPVIALQLDIKAMLRAYFHMTLGEDKYEEYKKLYSEKLLNELELLEIKYPNMITDKEFINTMIKKHRKIE